VEKLIEITGPVEVFGTTYSAAMDKRCGCPNVIYELENYSEIVAKGQSDRKAILGTLMQQILAKALTTSVDKLPEFITATSNLAAGKHLQLYMHDDKTETALDTLNWTGKVKDSAGDYLMINDSNFAGGKTNIYVTEKVTDEIDRSSGKHTLTIEYSNPTQYNSWLNGINRDFFRVYVPKGSNLTFSKGSLEAVSTSEELGKTVYSGFIQIRPQNSLTVTLQYTVPNSPQSGKYPLLIQKQGGTKDFQYTVKLGGTTKTFNLATDQDLKL